MDASRRPLGRLVGAAVVALALTAVATPTASAARPPDPAFDVGTNQTVVDGVARTYIVRRPDDAHRLPMLVVLHGAGGDGAGVERDTGFTAAIGGSAVVVYPDGLHGTWNAGGCCLQSEAEGVDDTAFVTKLVDAAVARGMVDPRRVFVAGFSNGGMLAYRLLCDVGARFAGAEVVAGAMVGPCFAPRTDARLLIVHSATDTMVPPRGYDGVLDTGQHLHYPSLWATVETWFGLLGCAGAPSIDTRATAGVEAHRWLTCGGGGELDVDLLSVFGHGWPGNRREPDGPAHPIDATYAAVSTFSL